MAEDLHESERTQVLRELDQLLILHPERIELIRLWGRVVEDLPAPDDVTVMFHEDGTEQTIRIMAKAASLAGAAWARRRPRPAMFPAEQVIWETAGACLDDVESVVAVEAAVEASAEAVRSQSIVGIEGLAGFLGVDQSLASQMCSEASLHFLTDASGERLFPRWQFEAGRPLPGLQAVLGALDEQLHPLSVMHWMLAANPDLEVGGRRLSPREWLVTSGPTEAVVALAADVSAREWVKTLSLSWHAICEAIPFGVGLVDPEGVIRYANGHLEALSGYRADELIGQSVELLVPREARHRHADDRRGFTKSRSVRQHDAVAGLTLTRADGLELPVDVALAPFNPAPFDPAPFDPDSASWTLALVRDDSARVDAELARSKAEGRAEVTEARARASLATSESRFRLAFDSSTSGMAIADLDHRLVAANRAYSEMLGRTAEELFGHGVLEFTHPEDRPATLEALRRLVSGEADEVRYKKRFLHSDGRVIYADAATAVMRDEAGAPVSYVASVKDFTEEHTLLAKLSHQALHDPLTGLANRALFEDRLAHAEGRDARRNGRSALFLLDLDDFKAVNDTLGHHVGDQLLVTLARRLEKVARSSDTLCRLGGDEFLYLAEGLTAPVEELAERLLGVFEAPFVLGGARLDQRASLGVVVDDSAGRDHDELLKHADIALYEAKRRGKGHYVVFDSELRERVSGHFELARELRNALGSGELTMAYQPLVELQNQQIIGFEALMRWAHPTKGAIPPDVFIPLAEQSDLILDLGRFALREACAAAASFAREASGAEPPRIAVNFSARQFYDPGLSALIDEALEQSGLAPDRLVVEITESVALVDVEATAAVFEHLRDLGATVALEDFGTGYSSLSYLGVLAPEVIKIDRSFVSAPVAGPVGRSLSAEAILEALVTLGHSLGLLLVAEGIETPAQLEHLRSLGCDFGQGYLFSPAVSAAEAGRMLRDSVAGDSGEPARGADAEGTGG